MKYLHNNSYDPSFPAVEIILRNDDEDLRTTTLAALLDTGADGSFVPLSYWKFWRCRLQTAVFAAIGENGVLCNCSLSKLSCLA